MAVFRVTSYTSHAQLAKKTIRYITHRRGRDGKTVTRPLFGREGGTDKAEAYEKIDKARPGTKFFRMIISPDPLTEDAFKDLDLREIMDQTMLSLQGRFPRQQIECFAAIHADHTDKRHVHVLVLLRGRLTRSHLAALRTAATKEAVSQRQLLDQERGIAPAIAQQTPPLSRRQAETRPIPVFTSREPRHADAPPSQAPEYARSATRTAWREPAAQLELRETICPLCRGTTPMLRLGSRLVCLTCGLSLHAGRSLRSAKEQGLSLERAREEVGTP